MRKFLIWSGSILLILLLVCSFLVIRFLTSSNYFTTLEPHFAGSCQMLPGVVGAEDLDIDIATGTLYLSALDRRRAGDDPLINGALYRMDLNDPEARPQLIWGGAEPGDFRPHGISLLPQPDGLRIFVINHPSDGSHAVEIFDVADTRLQHRETITDPLFKSPNDLAAIGPRRFYIGNDLANPPGIMQMLEILLPRAQTDLIYFDGERGHIAADGLAFANGVAAARDTHRLYLAEMTGKALRIFDYDPENGALTQRDQVHLQTFMDNINIDAMGNLWIGAHPKFVDIMRHSFDPAITAPAQVLRVSLNPEGGGKVDEVLLSIDGTISAVSAAAAYRDKLVLGPIFDAHFAICTLP